MYHCMGYIFDTFDISQQFEMVKLSTNIDLNAVVTLTWGVKGCEKKMTKALFTRR